MSNYNGKFGPNAVWLFAVFTLGVALGVTKLIPSITGAISPKAMAAVYFAVFGAGATIATFLTRARPLHAIGAFALAGVGLGAFYYLAIAGQAPASGFAATLGILFAAGFAIDALAAAVAGTLFGLKLRKNVPRAMAAGR